MCGRILLATATISRSGVQAFNEELDNMYEDIQLPEDQAWAAMTHDLRKAKETRNLFAKENQQLKRKLQALEQENKGYASFYALRSIIADAVLQDGSSPEAACSSISALNPRCTLLVVLHIHSCYLLCLAFLLLGTIQI